MITKNELMCLKAPGAIHCKMTTCFINRSQKQLVKYSTKTAADNEIKVRDHEI